MSEASDREWMRDRIDTIADGVSDLKTSIAEIRAQCPAHSDTIRDLKATVFGNGTPGLKTRVERIETAGAVSAKVIAGIAAISSVIASAIAWGIDHVVK